MVLVLVLLFRLRLGFCVSCHQPPGPLITPPSVLSVCEALVSPIKTLLDPKVVADGYL